MKLHKLNLQIELLTMLVLTNLMIKSLYYLRSMSLQRAEVVNQDASNVKVPLKGKINENEEPKENESDYEECLSCL